MGCYPRLLLLSLGRGDLVELGSWVFMFIISWLRQQLISQ
jgi:hypothetical protein